MPMLLVDAALLDGSTGSLPPHWLDGFTPLPFAARDLTVDTPGLDQAEALLLRTLTRLPARLLDAMPKLSGVATLSSGTDHLDVPALGERGIQLHTGHGGNARAVADWVHWALHRLGGELPWNLRRVLVIGAGAVGGAVGARLQALGAEVTYCDPPRAEREPGFRSVDLAIALQQPWFAVTLHVPLTVAGPHPTVNLLDAHRVACCHGAILLNAARGGILDERAAAKARLEHRLHGLALDTFVAEPRPDREVVVAADLVTPHIGGHSIEGKLRVARRAVRNLRAQMGLPEPGALADAVAEAVARLPTPADLLPFSRLDAADVAMRAASEAGESFDAVRHQHRRLELPLGTLRA
jgi:phosphoglycerate dehydrogenase-like enzyme